MTNCSLAISEATFLVATERDDSTGAAQWIRTFTVWDLCDSHCRLRGISRKHGRQNDRNLKCSVHGPLPLVFGKQESGSPRRRLELSASVPVLKGMQTKKERRANFRARRCSLKRRTRDRATKLNASGTREVGGRIRVSFPDAPARLRLRRFRHIAGDQHRRRNEGRQESEQR